MKRPKGKLILSVVCSIWASIPNHGVIWGLVASAGNSEMERWTVFKRCGRPIDWFACGESLIKYERTRESCTEVDKVLGFRSGNKSMNSLLTAIYFYLLDIGGFLPLAIRHQLHIVCTVYVHMEKDHRFFSFFNWNKGKEIEIPEYHSWIYL